MLEIADIENFTEAQPDDSILLICQNCRKTFPRSKKAIQSVLEGRNTHDTFEYCSQDCQRNACLRDHTTRSIPELKAQEYLSQRYPNEWIEYNDRKAIDMELDIVFLDRKIAIELNGGFHYKGIGEDGEEKLRKQQARDEEKRRRCMESGYTLITVDTRQIDHFSYKKARIIFDDIGVIVDNEIKRLEEDETEQRTPTCYDLSYIKQTSSNELQSNLCRIDG